MVGYSNNGSSNEAFRWIAASNTMTGLGTLGGNSSIAVGVSSDGSVVVGYSSNGTFTEAFRWTAASNTMTGLGHLGGGLSVALGVNSDGSVVVGYSNNVSFLEAFRWTAASNTMIGLGHLGGNFSLATAVNSDGSVVVGYSNNGSFDEAFRWTVASNTMTGLGHLGGGASIAQGVNSDGSVVVGVSFNGSYDEAFRWTLASNKMTGLGHLGGVYSVAFGVSGDGSVVVGISDTGTALHAFRWTAATGMKDLNTLLTNAGVNMTGITLVEARAISANGQFIVGSGNFSGATRAYIVRYYDGDPEPSPTSTPTVTTPIAGVTTVSSVQNSINNLADTRLGVLTQQQGFAAPLLGFNTPMGLGNEAGVFVTAGSVAGGGFMRYSVGNGLALLAGLSYAQEAYPDADLRHTGMGALALQYIQPGSGWWRPFVEGGGWYAPHAALDFSRTYSNGAGLATGTGHTTADLSYVYARAGLLFAVNKADQLAASAEIGRERMDVSAYTEPLTTGNPFEAHVTAGSDSTDIAKLRLQWSHRFSSRIDGTLWAAAVYGFNRTTDLTAMVPGIGVLQPAALGDLTWAEYGARIGYRISDATTLDFFANGVTGGGAIDTRIHTGAALRFQF